MIAEMEVYWHTEGEYFAFVRRDLPIPRERDLYILGTYRGNVSTINKICSQARGKSRDVVKKELEAICD